MHLNKLVIERIKFGSDAGQFKGVIRFDNELGEVAIKLSSEKCRELFMICADGIVDTAKTAAAELTCEVIEHKKAIENDPIE